MPGRGLTLGALTAGDSGGRLTGLARSCGRRFLLLLGWKSLWCGGFGAALPRWGKGRCVGAGRRCLPAARALREGARPILGFWDGGGGRNSPACKLGYCRARGERRTGCFDVWPHAQGHGSSGATAGPARTRLRDLSLKNPIGCRARIATLQRKPGGSCA